MYHIFFILNAFKKLTAENMVLYLKVNLSLSLSLYIYIYYSLHMSLKWVSMINTGLKKTCYLLNLFLFFGHVTWHVGSQFPNQDSDSHPLTGK